MAKITFEGFSVLSLQSLPAVTQDENGDRPQPDTQFVLHGQAAYDQFIEQTRFGIWIYALGKLEDNLYYLDAAMGMDFFFTLRFSFYAMTVEWDAFCQPAWYEHR